MTAMATLHTAHVAPLGLRRVYILPTRHGLLLLVLLLIILLGAINYDNALAYLLCFLLGGLFLVAMLHTYRNLAGLSLASAAVAPVVTGEPAVFMLQLASEVARPRYQLRLMQRAPSSKRARKTAVTLDLHTHTGAVALALPTHQRGRLGLHQVRLESTFPLGVLRAWAYFKSPAECIVYPRAAGHLPLPRRANAATATARGSTQGTDDFAELTRYREGDSLRAIHWPAYARRAELMVKRFEGEDDEVALTWDATLALGEVEARIAQLAQWVRTARALGVPYSLILAPQTFPPGADAAHFARVMTALALYA